MRLIASPRLASFAVVVVGLVFGPDCASTPVVDDTSVPGTVFVEFRVDQADVNAEFEDVEVCDVIDDVPPIPIPGDADLELRFHVTRKTADGADVRFDCGDGFGGSRPFRYGAYQDTGCRTAGGKRIQIRLSPS